MSEAPTEFYSEERWQNWIDRIRDEDVDPQDEDTARLLWNLQEDTAIAVAKVLSTFEEGDLDEETTMAEIADIRDIVLAEPNLDDDEKLMLVDGVQTSLLCVFAAAEIYVAAGPAEDGTVEEYIHAAADAEAGEDYDAALNHAAQAGTLVIDGADVDVSIVEDLEYGLVTEWVNGLDSLHSAMSDPEVVEEDE